MWSKYGAGAKGGSCGAGRCCRAATEAHLLVQVLGQHVDFLLVAAGVALVPEFKLGNNLQGRVGREGAELQLGGSAESSHAPA